jgi:ATP-binding cassette subfamily B protein
MAQELFEKLLFQRNTNKFKEAFVNQGDVEARFVPLLLMALAQTGGLFHAILLHQRGLITLGDVVAYFGLLLLFGFPTFVSLFAYSQISLGLAGARRILDLINHETDLDQNISGSEDELIGEVEFANVTFSYDQNSVTLSDLNFKVQVGQTVAIVGQTGSGKTSMVKLINRTYDVDSGSIKIDGKNIRQWNLEKLRQQISIIEQDVFLFSRSIADNIAFSCPHATQNEIELAAKEAQAHEFISGFKDGYQTIIGERGVTLSGGQKQRLALARAFLTNPKILILDDSTSSIDSSTEDKIQKAIFDASEGRTTFIITHRLSQIRWADQIMVLKNGEIDQIGNHFDLLKSSEAYGQIFKGE